MTDYDVVVVGAGIAGLTATQLLTQEGLSVRCCEARARIGGRAYSVADSGLAIDMGATWYWHNEPLVASFVEQLSLGNFLQECSGDAMFETVDGLPQRLQGNPIDVPSFRFAQGAQSLPDALAQLLPPGTVTLSCPVRRIEVGSSVTVTCDDNSLNARYVVCALPPALAVTTIDFAPELPGGVLEAASRTPVWMGDIVKAIAVYETPFWRERNLAGAAMSYRGPFREIHDHSGQSAGSGALFGFAPASRLYGMDDAEIGAAFEEQLTRILGEEARRPSGIHVVNWDNEEFTSPPVAVGRSAQGGFGHPELQEPSADGRMYWASTETDNAFGGHIEGAIRAGVRAAQGIVARLR